MPCSLPFCSPVGLTGFRVHARILPVHVYVLQGHGQTPVLERPDGVLYYVNVGVETVHASQIEEDTVVGCWALAMAEWEAVLLHNVLSWATDHPVHATSPALPLQHS